MNEFNDLPGDEPTDTPEYWNIPPPEVNFKSWTSTPKTSPVILDIMGRLNNHSIYNGDVEVYPYKYPFESTYELVPDLDTTTIKQIGDDKMD